MWPKSPDYIFIINGQLTIVWVIVAQITQTIFVLPLVAKITQSRFVAKITLFFFSPRVARITRTSIMPTYQGAMGHISFAEHKNGSGNGSNFLIRALLSPSVSSQPTNTLKYQSSFSFSVCQSVSLKFFKNPSCFFCLSAWKFSKIQALSSLSVSQSARKFSKIRALFCLSVSQSVCQKFIKN